MSRTRHAMPSREELVRNFHYNPETGVFVRARDRGTRWRRGDICGSVCANGYLYLSLHSRQFLAHRAAWLIVHGNLDGVCIDHINGNRRDNRIANLRAATPHENATNIGHTKRGLGRAVGGYYNSQAARWQARIRIGSEHKHLGYFDTWEQANAAFADAKRQLHPFAERWK